jgi:hypothetical protein
MARWILDPDFSDVTGQELRQVLAEAVGRPDELQELWESVGLVLADVAWLGTARVIWLAMLREAHARGRLEALVRLVADRKPGAAARLHAVLTAEVRDGPWYHGSDPYAPRLLGRGGRRGLIDRSSLSQRLRQVAEQDYLVLSIRGDAGTGRSHSRQLVDHVARRPHRAACSVVPLDVRIEWPPDTYHAAVDAHEFARVLAQKLDMDPIFRTDVHTEASRISHDLADQFVARFERLDAGNRWVFVDGLDRPGVLDDVHAFVGHLAVAAEQNRLGETRLIVTGHRGEFAPDVIRNVYLEERIDRIDRSHVERFFADIADHLGKPLREGEPAALADRVLGRAALEDLQELERVAVEVARDRFSGS